MSFILDAIAKSERERQQQQTPDASSLAFPAAAPARSRSIAAYVLVGLLLLASAILGALWVQSPRFLAPYVGPGGPALPTAPDAAGRPQAPVESRDAPPVAPADTPQPVSTQSMLAGSSSTKTMVPAPPPADEAPAAAAEKNPPAARTPGETTLETAAIAPVKQTAGTDSRPAGNGSDTDASGIGAGSAESAPSAIEAPRRRVSRLQDLPADVRQALPSVVFTGHLYSRNPRASYVFVDGGRQVVAGQQIVDDLVLDEITPSGVVVEFQGYLIEVGVLQNWSLK